MSDSLNEQSRAGGERAARGFEDWLPLTAVRTAPGEYDIVNCEGQVLWSMEGRSLAEWVCALVNAAPVVAAAVAWAAAVDAHERAEEAHGKMEEDEAVTADELIADRLKLVPLFHVLNDATAALREAVEKLREGEG